jgi:hypothetical protein
LLSGNIASYDGNRANEDDQLRAGRHGMHNEITAKITKNLLAELTAV